ncbi:MAG: hypothetical protein MUF16_22100, partial [Burkholderiaceae bacterium]|nr:hypothetical protein [Burkholderiaceae bacterium]
MKSRRLQGCHRLIDRFSIQVDARNDGQRVLQLQSNQNPVFKGRSQRLFALSQGISERNDAQACG